MSHEPVIRSFFDANTFSYSYVVSDPDTGAAAVIDSVFDYEQGSSRISTRSADEIIAYITDQELRVEWLLETHVHADHLSAAGYLNRHLGGRSAIGDQIGSVQRTFSEIFQVEPDFAQDGSQFDRLLADGERLPLGSLTVEVMHTPGHTAACVTYLIGEVAFVGDTLFMPDYGTARTDFPGGDAKTLYQSIQRLLALPDATTLYLCHDYGSPTRSSYQGQVSVREERLNNVHVHAGISEQAFVEFRQARDAELAAPRLLYPAVQFNMRGALAPPPETNGQSYFKIPINGAALNGPAPIGSALNDPAPAGFAQGKKG